MRWSWWLQLDVKSYWKCREMLHFPPQISIRFGVSSALLCLLPVCDHCPTFHETWRTDVKTSTLIHYVLVFPKWHGRRRCSVARSITWSFSDTSCVPFWPNQEKWCLSPLKKKYTTWCEEKTTITAQNKRWHVGSWRSLFWQGKKKSQLLYPSSCLQASLPTTLRPTPSPCHKLLHQALH